ncbi:Uncharacterized protein Adt_11761 [Abeliophyllum distichum]|uniref:CCHC-type domain-containing protein n=1 Tax=Abeliophyllum distichum TaxID=126358 RepID=A0ABD1UNS1_9LAMI
MKVEELVGSLMTYELHLQRRKKEKGSSIAFKIKNHEDKVDCEESETNENMAMLTKQFKKFLKRNQKGKNLNTSLQQKKRFLINTKQNPTTPMNRSDNRIQCHECEGFGHIASDCANTLKKSHTKKAMNITWSDDDEKDSDEDEDDRTSVDQVTTFEEPVRVCYSYSSMNKKLHDEQEKNLSTQVMLEFLEDDKAEIDSQNNILTNILKEKDDQIVKLLDELKVSKERIKQLTIGASRLSETLSYERTPNVKEDKTAPIAVRTKADLPMQEPNIQTLEEQVAGRQPTQDNHVPVPDSHTQMEHSASSSDVSAPAPGGSDVPNTNNEQNIRTQPPSWIQKAHPLENVLLDSGDGMMTRRRLANELGNVCYTSQIEPKI